MTHHSDQNQNRPTILSSKDLTPEEFESLCDVFATLLKWDQEERSKGKLADKGRAPVSLAQKAF